jgi:ABC-2 type transport system permease protein
MSKLRSVIRHEYNTVVKQPSFWVYMLVMPLIFVLIFVLIAIANRSDSTSLETLVNDLKGVAVVDASGLVSKEIVEASGQTFHPASELEALRQDVESGERKGLIYYPEDLTQTTEYDVYVHGNDFIFSTSVSEVGGALLRTSLYAPLGSPEVIALAQQGADAVTTTYANGSESVGFTRFIIPGAIAAMFFIILFFSIGYILTSISDEKENRSMEMALTYLSPRTLIVGKLIGVVLVTLTQLVFFGALGIIALLIAINTDLVQLPSNFNLAELPVDPIAILFGIGFVIVGFILFASFMAFIAALLPAKQANNFSALFYILPFAPTWFIVTVLTDPDNPVVQFITYFPLTAPTTNLIRNTVGNIPVNEAALSLGIMALTALLVLALVVKIFPKGALEFQNPLSLKSIFARK